MKKPGFTLVEVIIIIALISVLLLIALPKAEYFNKFKEMAEIKEFKRDVLLARNKAIMECKKYRVLCLAQNNGYQIDRTGGDGYYKRKHFQSGLQMVAKDGVKVVYFNPNGTVGGAKTIYFLNSYGQKYEMAITPVSGNVRVDLVRIEGN